MTRISSRVRFASDESLNRRLAALSVHVLEDINTAILQRERPSQLQSENTEGLLHNLVTGICCTTL
jgi:hypothetical protein